MMDFKRARSEDQIKEREDSILKVSKQMYEEEGYDNVTIEKIAERLSVSRPTVYKYFPTKEDIFMEVLLRDLHEWISDLCSSFGINKIYSMDEIARIWTDRMMEHHNILGLYPVLFINARERSSSQNLSRFRDSVFCEMISATELMEQLFPGSSMENINAFLLTQLSFAVGLFPMCNITNKQKTAIQNLGGTWTDPDFEDLYFRTVLSLMKELL